MEPKAHRFKKIWLTFEKREDGGLRVYSEDVPGFILSHKDCHLAFSDVKEALEKILSEMLSVRVTVGPLENLRDDLEDNGIIPIYTSLQRRQYVVQVDA
jgi:hypothetical protein